MNFKKAVASADKLAFEKGIGRTTLNVLEHPKANTLTIVEELSRFADGHEIKQRFYNHIDLSLGKVNVNSEVDYLKTVSTYRFLGREAPEMSDLKRFVLAGRVNDEPEGTEVVASEQEAEQEAEQKVEQETPKDPDTKEVEVLEEPSKEVVEEKPEVVEEPKPKTRKKKAATAKKPKKSKNIVFDREVQPHVRHAAICIKEVLGAGWKDEKANTDAVKDLIFNILHKRAEILEPEGTEPLKVFKEMIREFLTKRLDLAGEELDVDDGLDDL